MPRTIDLGYISSATNASAFIVTDNGRTNRVRYDDISYWLGVKLGITQELTRNSSVNFLSVETANTGTFTKLRIRDNISIGQSSPYNTTGDSIYISNDRIGVLGATSIKIVGYSSKYNDLATNYPVIKQEFARNISISPTGVLIADKLGSFTFGGYDTLRFINTASAHLTFSAAETWFADNIDSRRVGTSFVLATQPTSTILSDTSRFAHIWQEWTTSGDSIAINNLYIGDGAMNTNTVVRRDGGAIQQGHGSTQVSFVNSQLKLIGVPLEATTAADNPSLDDTLRLTFVAGRGSGAKGRRNKVLANDTLGIVDYRAQYQNSSTNLGVAVGNISMQAINDFSITDWGTKLLINTINSGTVNLSTRLNLSSKIHTYSSDNHLFYNSDGILLATLSTSTGFIFYTTTTFSAGISTSATLATRENKVGSIASTASGSTATLNILGFKSYMVTKVQTTYPAWVRIYTDATGRSNDFYRDISVDPSPDSGVVLEVVTTSGGLSKVIAPGVLGFNNDSPTSATLYVSVTNNDVVSRATQVTLTLLQLEF